MKRPANVMLRSLLALGLAGLTSAASLAAESPGELIPRAQAAAAAGDSDAAIALYDQHLLESPDDTAVLQTSAQLLSWQGRYDQAIERYDRVLALDPQNRFAQLERAKVLSWAQRYPEAVSAFRSLLALEPDHLPARIGLARTLSWSGQFTAAEAEYAAVLRTEPDDPDALLGIAQVYAWSGQFGRAREAYRVAAGAEGSAKHAEVGLAYLDLWEGAAGAARRSAEALHAKHPDDTDVAGLLAAARAATSAWSEVAHDEMNDTDDNRLSTTRLQGGMWLGERSLGRLTYTHYDVTTLRARGSIESLQARGEWMPAPGHRLELLAGMDRLDSPTRTTKDVLDWGLTYRFPIGASLRGWLGVNREPFRYSVPLLDNAIIIDSHSGGLQADVGPIGTLAGSATSWKLSDGNRRQAYEINTLRQWQLGGHTLSGGAIGRWLAWERDLDNGYFDPDTFRAYGIAAQAYGPLGHEHLTYSLSVEAGLQSFVFAGRRTTDDPYHVVTGLLGWQLHRTTRLELFAESGSYASQGAQEWRYDRLGIRLNWRPSGLR